MTQAKLDRARVKGKYTTSNNVQRMWKMSHRCQHHTWRPLTNKFVQFSELSYSMVTCWVKETTKSTIQTLTESGTCIMEEQMEFRETKPSKCVMQYWSCACTTGVIKSSYIYTHSIKSRKRFSTITVVLDEKTKCFKRRVSLASNTRTSIRYQD